MSRFRPGPLARALELKGPTRLAVAGSGGKSTLLVTLGKELAKSGERVILTTTTHFYPPKAGRTADIWLLGNSLPDPGELEARMRPNRWLTVAKGRTLDGKLKGIGEEQAKALSADPDIWLLIEADGSQRKPLKGWADFEPVIPEVSDTLLVLAGARGLSRNLSLDWVHRPELFAREAGIEINQRVTPQALARVLMSEKGPTRDWPEGKKSILLVNQADAASPAELSALARALAEAPGRPYDLHLSGSLKSLRLKALEA